MLSSEYEGNLGSLFSGGTGKDLNQVTNELKEKLDRAESEQMRAEGKLRAATVSWERERRQLRDQIDRFRQALARSSADVKETDGLGRRLEETIRYSQQLELKCQEQAVAKESEQKDFQSRIEDLENQIVEWISRSHNTHRRVQSGERRMETELASRKRVVEIEFERKLRSEQGRWQKTQRVLEGEIASLRKELASASFDKPSVIRRFFSARR